MLIKHIVVSKITDRNVDKKNLPLTRGKILVEEFQQGVGTLVAVALQGVCRMDIQQVVCKMQVFGKLFCVRQMWLRPWWMRML